MDSRINNLMLVMAKILRLFLIIGVICPVNSSGSGLCSRVPCANDGLCVETADDFICICGAQFEGRYCKTKKDLCANRPCQNGGICSMLNDGSAGYNCNCTGTGYEGIHCTVETQCTSNPCKNRGFCILQNGGSAGYYCDCSGTGYRGPTCNIVNYCHHVTCQNGGSCVNLKDSYKCICRREYIGQFCEIMNYCHNVTCQNSGYCENLNDSFECICEKYYPGEFCENPHCPENYAYFRQRKTCYGVFDKKNVSKFEAYGACKAEGAHLVDVTTYNERFSLVEYLKEIESDDVWSGLEVDFSSGKLVWTDGTPFDPKIGYGPNISQPNSHDETNASCTQIQKSLGYQWAKETCHSKSGYVCEMGDVETRDVIRRVPKPYGNDEAYCPKNYKFIEQSCYRVYDKRNLTKFEADVACKFEHAHLVDLNTAVEISEFVHYLYGIDSDDIWSGLEVNNASGQLAWTDGSPLNPAINYGPISYPGSHDEASATCVQIQKSIGYYLAKKTCLSRSGYACEIDITISECEGSSYCSYCKDKKPGERYACRCPKGIDPCNHVRLNDCKPSDRSLGHHYVCSCGDGEKEKCAWASRSMKNKIWLPHFLMILGWYILTVW